MSIRRTGLFNIGVIGLEEMGAGALGIWTPAKATDSGGVLPHTWYYGEQPQKYQDSALTIPVAADGDVIGGLVNQGSDVYNVLQATTANKPTWQTNVQGGRPVFRFDGGDELVGAFGGGAIAQPYTVFAVAQLDAGAVNDNQDRSIIGDTTLTVLAYQTAGFAPDRWAIFSGIRVDSSNSDANWTIWTVLYNGASSQFWHNGVSESSGDAGANALSGLSLGSGNGARFWIGDIAEILIYASNLSNADKNQIGLYLSIKYGITYTSI